MTRLQRRLDTDRGDSLIEILVSLAVLGIGVTALLTGLATNASVSDTNKQQAQLDTAAASAAEYVKALPYTDSSLSCGAATTPLPTTTLPRDATFDVNFGPAVALPGAIPAGNCSDIKRVPITISGNGFTSVTISVIRRSP